MVMDHFLHFFLFTIRIAAIYAGWWYTYPSEKYDESSVGMMTFKKKWKIWKIKAMFETTNQYS